MSFMFGCRLEDRGERREPPPCRQGQRDDVLGPESGHWLFDPVPAGPPPPETRPAVAGALGLVDELLRLLGASVETPLTVRPTAGGVAVRRVDPLLSQVYVEPTNSCNLNCRTCVRRTWSEPQGLLDIGVYRRLIVGLRDQPGLRRVSFWGIGEPLLHPEITEMVALAHALGVETQIITNGLLLDEVLARGLVAAGLDRLIVSVDGALAVTQAYIRSGSDLGRVVHNVGLLHAARGPHSHWKPEIGIAFVLMRRNLGELPYLRGLARALHANLIVLTNVLPYSEELKDEILYWYSAGRSYPSGAPSPWFPEIVFPRIDVQPELFRELSDLLGRPCSLVTLPADAAAPRGYCRFVEEGSIAVSWDGGVSPCVPLMHDYTCYILNRPKTIRRCVLGNLVQTDLAAIWESPEFVRVRDVVRRFPFAPCTDCGGCELADSNEEDCLGNTFPVCGDCLWAKGVIQCP